MDPDEAMRRLRDRMIEISDMVSKRLTHGGSSLNAREIAEVVESAHAVAEIGEDLLEWLARGGYVPSSR